MKTFRDQVLASTHLDAQGERTPVEVLRRLCTKDRMQLRHQHDYGRPPIGFIENMRVVEDPDSPGDWLLIGNVSVDSGSIDEALRGFSYSVTDEFAGNMGGGYAAVYLPFPHYNDRAWIDSICESDPRLTIGRWRQKNVDPATTALLVTMLLWVFEPAWQDAYQSQLKPRIKSLLSKIPVLRAKGIKTNFIQLVSGPSGEEVRVMFFPDGGAAPSEPEIFRGLLEVERHFQGQAHGREIQQVSLHRTGGKGAFKITRVEFVDGGDYFSV